MGSVSIAKIKSLKHELYKFRSIKSNREIALLRRAGDISGTAHAKVCTFALGPHYVDRN
jgi:Xaa-Pro aminopeptidase